MKRLLFSFLMLALALPAFAQMNDLIVFAPEGEKFFLVVDGLRYNGVPGSNVLAAELKPGMHKAKVIFEDTKLPSADFNVGFEGNQELTYQVKKKNTKPGEPIVYVARLLNVLAKGSTPPPPPPPAPTTTIVTPTELQVYPAAPGISLNVGLPGISMNVTAPGVTTTVGTSTTTTTTTTNVDGFGTSVTVTERTSSSPNTQVVVSQPAPTVVYVPGYNGVVGCPVPMNSNDFNSAIATVKKQGFDETRMNIAKQVVGSNCLTADQVKAMCQTFSFEQTKLDFAKFAYTYTYDRNNYFKLNEVFSFSSSVDELTEHISHIR